MIDRRLLLAGLLCAGCDDPGNEDRVAPSLSDATPITGTTVTDAYVVIGVSTDEPATCRYATAPGMSYDAMSDDLVALTPMRHQTIVGRLDNAATYSFYVRCRDVAGNSNAEDWVIAFLTSLRAKVFRSIGPASTTPLALGGGLGIAGGVARFPVPLPARVGVGDIVQYDTNADDSPDALAMVTSRLDAQTYGIAGVDAGDTAPCVNAQFEVLRAYTSLANAINGVENVGIASALRDFDAFGTPPNLVARDRIWNLVGYGDAVDEGNAVISGWTTDATHPLRIYTPVHSREVGESQRHDGVWRDEAYTLRNVGVGDGNVALTTVSTQFIEIIGLQFDVMAYPGVENVGANFTYTGGGVIRVEASILRGHGNGVGTRYMGVKSGDFSGAHPELHLVNNIAYGFRGAATYMAPLDVYGGTRLVAVNNTLADSALCSKTGRLINNVFFGCDRVLPQFESMSEGSGYNATNTPSFTGATAGEGNRTTVTFGFRNATARDYRLGALDVGARDQATSDVGGALDSDIQGEPRSGSWDVGADEYVP